jgi:hypothetical protein
MFGAVNTVQACVLDLSSCTASCHHERLIEERTVRTALSLAFPIPEQRRVFLRSVEKETFS